MQDPPTGSLFPEADAPPTAPGDGAPLAERLRPRNLEQVVGQDEILAPGRPLRRAIEAGTPPSLILWGPPGSGKTTLAHVIRSHSRAPFEALSAVLSGVRELREILRQATDRRRRQGISTLLFIDEIHRYNKAQQDALLAHVESGEVTLIGATTENPSFEVNAALLSRTRVVVLKPLAEEHIARILERALREPNGLRNLAPVVASAALRLVAHLADGDARRALNVLELAVSTQPPDTDGCRHVDEDVMRQAWARKSLRYDKNGEEHFNLISALHKSVRNSDADAALYWLARMLEAGEEPAYVARRLMRVASEDVGLADPQALVQAVATQQAVHFIGLPEGKLALAQLVVYLAAAPKSNAVYKAYGQAAQEALTTAAEPVPLWIRNAPTGLMKHLGYGKGYRYAHDEPAGTAPMECLPESLVGRRYYRPTSSGQESDVGARLEAARRARAKGNS